MNTVRYSHFWPGFEPKESFLLQVTNFFLGEITVIESKRPIVDLEYSSVFMSRNERLIREFRKLFFGKSHFNQDGALTNVKAAHKRANKSKKSIWYTGENVRPPLCGGFDYFLSFDQDTYGGRNFYLPLWMATLDWFDDGSYNQRLGGIARAHELILNRSIEDSKKKFAVAFIGNHQDLRFEAVKSLSKLGAVDVFGKAVGRPIRDKKSIAKEYKYSICFENDLYPGYVTEKLIEAYLCETIPLYWGDLGTEHRINKNSFINLADYESLTDFVEAVDACDYEKVYNQRFFNELPTLESLRALFT